MKCEACPPDTYYNITMRKCVKCATGTKFDSVLQKCIGGNDTLPVGQCPSDHPYYNPYLKQCEQCGQNLVYDPDLQKCINNNNIGFCPHDRPFFDINNKVCIPCPQGTYYNPYHYICEQGAHRHSLQLWLFILCLYQWFMTEILKNITFFTQVNFGLWLKWGDSFRSLSLSVFLFSFRPFWMQCFYL